MFAVVIPLFNKRDTLRRAVDSVLAQDQGVAEIIIVDDGSTDGGVETIADVRDPRLRIVRQANAGEGAARNSGIAASGQDWVALLDADDYWLPGHVAELAKIRGACPGAMLIGTAFGATSGQRPIALPSGPARIGSIDYFATVGRGIPPFCASSAAIHQAAWRDCGGFGPWRAGADTEFWARVALRHRVASSTRITAVYWWHPASVSGTQKSRWLGNALGSVIDLTPAVATVLDQRPSLPRQTQQSIDSFVYRNAIWCLRASARLGDLRTLRSLKRIFPGRPTLLSRAALAAASLPAPLAEFLCRWLSRLDARLDNRFVKSVSEHHDSRPAAVAPRRLAVKEQA